VFLIIRVTYHSIYPIRTIQSLSPIWGMATVVDVAITRQVLRGDTVLVAY